MKNTEIKQSPPTEEPPKEPVVPCLGCGNSFVWWIHPVQLCDECIAKEYEKVEQS